MFSHNMPQVMGLTECDQQLSGMGGFDPLCVDFVMQICHLKVC